MKKSKAPVKFAKKAEVKDMGEPSSHTLKRTVTKFTASKQQKIPAKENIRATEHLLTGLRPVQQVPHKPTEQGGINSSELEQARAKLRHYSPLFAVIPDPVDSDNKDSFLLPVGAMLSRTLVSGYDSSDAFSSDDEDTWDDEFEGPVEHQAKESGLETDELTEVFLQRKKGQYLSMTDVDKLYLFLVGNELEGVFSILYFKRGISSIKDLKHYIETKSPDPHLIHKEKLESLKQALQLDGLKYQDYIRTQKDIKRNTFKQDFRSYGILQIDVADLTIIQLIEASSKYSGSVYYAKWARADGVQVDVCLRCPSDESQLEMFIEEAKFLADNRHERILKLYGVVVLGSYVNSIGLVVELALGNLQDRMFPGGIRSVRTVYSYACQVAGALEHLHNKNNPLHAIVPPFIYLFANEKVKLGGFGLNWSLEHKTKLHPYGFNIDFLSGTDRYDIKKRDLMYLFGQIVRNMYKSLPTEWSSTSEYFRAESPRYWQQYRFPDDMLELIEQCTTTDMGRRPNVSEVVKFLEQHRPLVVKAAQDYTAKQPIEMSYNHGDSITVMSQKPAKFMPQDLWFGQKEDGTFGFFSKDNVDNESGDDGDKVPAEITARGPEAEHAYRKALLEGKVKMYRGRIMLIGQDRAGKTSLKKSLLGLPFNADEQSTVGIEVDPSSFEVDVEQVSSWQRLHDVIQEGSQSERALAKLIAEQLMQTATGNNMDDVDTSSDKKPPERRDTLEKARERTEENRKVSEALEEAFQDLDIAQEKPPDTMANVEEGVPSENSVVSQSVRVKLPEELARLVADYLKGNRPNQKETVLDMWDFAGQHLYYATHPVFFSSRAVYVLIYNLSKDPRERAEPCVRQGVHSIKLDNNSNETNLENLISWLVTVHGIQGTGKGEAGDYQADPTELSQLTYQRPPVLIVGTHADKAKLPAQRAHALLSEAISGKTYVEHVIRPFFTVDNTKSSEDPGVQELKKGIAKVLESEPYMGETLPAKWLNFEKAINVLVEQKVYYKSLEEVRHIAESECFITDSKEVDTMLNFYHDLRVIVKHGGTVVLQSEWLINLFRSLITIRSFEDMDPAHTKYWRNLEKTGVLHKTLIDHVCRGYVQSAATQDDLLCMMEHYGLIAKFKCSQATNGGSTECEEYFVPAQLTSSPSSLAKACPGPDDPCPLFIHFTDGFVPHGLFSQLVSRLMFQFSEMGFTHRPNLFCNAARFVVGQTRMYDLYLVRHKRSVKVTLRTLATQAPTIHCHVPIQLRMLLEDTLLELSRDWEWLRGMSYEVCVQCCACATNCDGCEDHGQVGCPDDDCVHLLRVCQEPLVCDRVFGEDSCFTVPGLQFWFAPKRDMTEVTALSYKPSTPPTQDLTLLARDIGSLWKRLGRALGLDEPELEQLEADERHLYERCYGVLRRWTEIQASAATYESLGQALLHQTVLRRDLALKYCTMC